MHVCAIEKKHIHYQVLGNYHNELALRMARMVFVLNIMALNYGTTNHSNKIISIILVETIYKDGKTEVWSADLNRIANTK